MICDVRLIFLGDNNFGVLKYKPHIQSPLRYLVAENTDGKPDQTLDQTQSSETSSGTMVGILNDNLNSGTVVTLPQSPISVELEAAKGLLALKSEGKVMNQQLETPPPETVTENLPVQTETDNQKASALLSHAGVSESKTEETVVETKQRTLNPHELWKQTQWKHQL